MPQLRGSPFRPAIMAKTSFSSISGSSHHHSTDASADSLPPPVPPKAIDLNSSTRSTDRETGAKVTRRAFLCDVIVEREGEETTALLAHLGQPVSPLSTLPPPTPHISSRPSTPSRPTFFDDDSDDTDAPSEWSMGKREELDKRLQSLIEELVRTERSYILRIKALKNSYADPLRHFAKQGYSVIIPMYEAKTLFANIDAVLPAAMAFLADLEAMWSSRKSEAVVGDICLKHLKDLKTFDPYRTYISNQDESQKTFQEMHKKVATFASFIESTKYQTTGIGNIGLRELLMEPVQRIPRYTLLWQAMTKCMSPLSDQRAKLLEATEIASRIARCEADSQTVRATVMYCLQRNVEGFPANLFSNNRDYIDSLDVEDMPAEYSFSSPRPSRPLSVLAGVTNHSTSLTSLGSTPYGGGLPPPSPQKESTGGIAPLHCTLFLFDDKLMIVKRQSSSISGCKVTGLDDVPKLVKSGGGIAIMDKDGAKKDKLSYRGVVDVLDVIATDVGNGDFHIFLERPPLDQSDRWSARPFRAYSTVHPPYAISFDPSATRRDKLRFIHNLWAAQALARTKVLPSHIKSVPRVMTAHEEVPLDRVGEAFARAKVYWNIWERSGWTAEQRKAKVALHIDEDGNHLDLPLVEDGEPRLVFRLQPMSGGLCRFSFTTTMGDGSDEARTVITLNEVNERIVQTIHRFGVFKFRTTNNSAPNTPSSSAHRLRPAMLNLDAISRNLFGTGSMSARSNLGVADAFGTSGSKRTRSTTSRSSLVDYGSLSGDVRSVASGSPRGQYRWSTTPSSARSDGGHESSQPQKEVGDVSMAPSDDVDLNDRLNLARKNSRSMASMASAPVAVGRVSEMRERVEAKEREREAFDQAETNLRTTLKSQWTPASTMPLRINKSPSLTRSMRGRKDETPRQQHSISTLGSSVASPIVRTRSPVSISLSSTSLARSSTSASMPLSPRPHGPRSPGPRGYVAPLPPPAPISTEILERPSTRSVVTTPIASPTLGAAASGTITPTRAPGLASAHTKIRVVSGHGRRISLGREMIPLKVGDENESPVSMPSAVLAKRHHSAEQLTPRKRSPNRSPLQPRDGSESKLPDAMRVPSGASTVRQASSRRTSGTHTSRASRRSSGTPSRKMSTVSVVSIASDVSVTNFTARPATSSGLDVVMSETTDLQSAMESATQKIMEAKGTARRARIEVAALRKQFGKDRDTRREKARSMYDPRLERGLDRTPTIPRSPQTRNIHRAQLTLSAYDDFTSVSSGGKGELDSIAFEELAHSVSTVVERLETQLASALADAERARELVHDANGNSKAAAEVAAAAARHAAEVATLESQIERAKEREDLVKKQLSESQMEVEEIYNAFNAELDGMYADATLPAPDERAAALRRDLQDAKSQRNVVELENRRLRLELEEERLKRDQWAKMLRARGVIP